jgi:hypothetical protein
MTREELIETLAVAAYRQDGDDPPFHEANTQIIEGCCDIAESVLAAIDAAGLAVVPVEATGEMVSAGNTRGFSAAVKSISSDVWSAMLAAGRVDQ